MEGRGPVEVIEKVVAGEIVVLVRLAELNYWLGRMHTLKVLPLINKVDLPLHPLLEIVVIMLCMLRRLV